MSKTTDTTAVERAERLREYRREYMRKRRSTEAGKRENAEAVRRCLAKKAAAS